MRFSAAAAVVAFAASVSAFGYGNGTDYTTTTEIVKELTTYCPHPTTVVQGSKTYTVSEATTLTITDCPCTLTHTYTSAPAPKPTPTEETPEHVPVPTGTPAVPTTYGSHNETKVAPTYAPSSAPAAPSSSDVYTGAASRATVAGSALVGLLGAFAFLL